MVLLQGFRVFFRKHPLVANSVIYGTLYVGAELSQQTFTKKYLPEKPESYDGATLARYGVMGTFLYSPILYNWYKWLDKTLPGTAKKVIVKKLLLDQFFMTPQLLVIFYTGMSIMEGQPDPLAECKDKFVPTFVRSCLFWLPAQTINFNIVPPQFRVIYVGTCSLIWANILCWVKRQNTADETKTEN